jgi:hypothetical protein
MIISLILLPKSTSNDVITSALPSDFINSARRSLPRWRPLGAAPLKLCRLPLF